MDADSREVLLRTAERLFAEQCVAAVSLRTVNREAGQKNHSAVHYHFGDKTGLLQALCGERGPHLARLRQDYLDSVKLTDGVADPVEQSVNGLLFPIVELLKCRGGGNYVALCHQMLMSPAPEVRALVANREDHRPLRRIRTLLGESLDHLNSKEIERRVHQARLLIGAMITELVAHHGGDDDELLAGLFGDLVPQLLPELVAMMRAPTS